MPAYGEPKQINSPDGSTVRFAFSAEEEHRILMAHAAFNAYHRQVYEASLAGRDAPPSPDFDAMLKPRSFDEPERRGPGRPRNVETV